MKTRIAFLIAGLAGIIAILVIPSNVMATQVTIDGGETYTKTYDLQAGDWLSWSWDVIGYGSVDFWVEDSNGIKHQTVYNETSDTGTFYADTPGRYYLKWQNDGSTPLVVDYTVSSADIFNPAREMISTMILTAAIIGIIILVVIIVIVVLVLQAGKKEPTQPQYPQPYQPQQYYQQPYQQYYDQQYPQQPQQPGERKPPGQ